MIGPEQSRFDWRTVESPTDMALYVASKTLETAQFLVYNAHDVKHFLHDAAFIHHEFGADDSHRTRLIVDAQSPWDTRIRLENKRGVKFSAKHLGSVFSIDCFELEEGPYPLSEVTFKRIGNGEDYGFDLTDKLSYGERTLTTCMDIASVLSNRMRQLTGILERAVKSGIPVSEE